MITNRPRSWHHGGRRHPAKIDPDNRRTILSGLTVIAAGLSRRARDRMPALVLGLAMGLTAFAVTLTARIRAQDCARPRYISLVIVADWPIHPRNARNPSSDAKQCIDRGRGLYFQTYRRGSERREGRLYRVCTKTKTDYSSIAPMRRRAGGICRVYPSAGTPCPFEESEVKKMFYTTQTSGQFSRHGGGFERRGAPRKRSLVALMPKPRWGRPTRCRGLRT